MFRPDFLIHNPFQHQVYLPCSNILNPSSGGCAARHVTGLEAEEKIMQVSEMLKNSFSLLKKMAILVLIN